MTAADTDTEPTRDSPARLPSPLQEIQDERLAARSIRLLLKRDDLIHPEVPGNKWRKLKYNLATARESGQQTLLTFGGAYSNHIRATAAAGRLFGFQTIGVIRGEKHLPLNPVLAFAVENGMRLTYLDRETYRRKTESAVLADLRDQFGDFFLLPEGGSNPDAVRGCAEIPGEIDVPFDVICCPCGTGGTLAGIAAGLDEGQEAIGFSALKGGQFLYEDVAGLQRETYGQLVGKWSIALDYHFGGYAKKKPELLEFINGFRERHGFTADWIYVGKMLYGIIDLVSQGKIRPQSTVVAVITG